MNIQLISVNERYQKPTYPKNEEPSCIHTSEVLHDHVRNVEIRQSFLQRITKVGSLGISSSGQDGIEIEVRDMPKPYELKSLIDAYRNM